VVLNTHNVEADLCGEGWIRRQVAAIERRGARSVQHVFCCSEADRAFFASIVGAGRTSVVPNGIDTSRFEGIASERAPLRQALGYQEQDRVLLFAASSFAPNVEALQWLVEFTSRHQELLESRNLHFLVAGSVSKQPFDMPRLKVVGMVPRIEPYFAAADLAFNGVFRGSGTNVKMAEFMAAGLPILTSVSGMRGYDVVDGEDCIAFTQDNLASVLADNALLQDPGALASMAARAYEKNKRQIDMAWCVMPLAQWLEKAA
jgi:glycosyltransferase involved in cell wall biosynthesis